MRPRPGLPSFGALPDDRLGAAAVSVSVAELHWTPDVAPMVMDRIARDAVAYPERFDRRPPVAPPPTPLAGPAQGPSASRAFARLVVLALVLAAIVVLVVLAAGASGPGVAAVAPMLFLSLETA